MADVGVFGRYKGFSDFQEAAKKNNLAEALTVAKLQGAIKGDNLPAALQMANKVQELEGLGTPEAVAQAARIREFAKVLEKGQVSDGRGGVMLQPGYIPAVTAVAGAKAVATEQGKKDVQAVMNPIIAGGVADATNTSKLEFDPLIKDATDKATKLSEAQANLPSLEAGANDMLAVINKLKKDKEGMKAAVGMNSVLPTIPGGKAANYEAQLKRLSGSVFLQAYERLKGGGAITGIEGEKGEAAIAALQTNQSEEAFNNSLKDLEAVVKKGLENARLKAQAPQAADVFDATVPTGNSQETLEKPPAQPVPKISGKDAQASLFNARKAIKANPSARAGIIQKLEAAGISAKGL